MKVRLYRKILKPLLKNWYLNKADSLWTKSEIRNAKLVEIAHMWHFAKTQEHMPNPYDSYETFANLFYKEIITKYKKYSRKYWTAEARIKRKLNGEKD